MRLKMGYKTISLSEDAYNRLLKRKIGSESFSDVIIRITNDTTLRDIVGILSDDVCDEIESNILKLRKHGMERFTESITEDWSSEAK